jgi:transcriptional regulator with XRE-family HTH domain
MDKVKMGNFLAKLRSEKNLRQQDEADIFQVSPQAISKWESGDSVPDIATLEKLSNFFNVGIDEIINGERKTPTTNVNTVVVARNPSMEERGLGKDYYGVFIYAMSALFLSFFLALIPYVFFYAGGVDGSPLYQEANLYEVLFRSSTWITILCWLMVLFFLASTLLSIGLWLDKSPPQNLLEPFLRLRVDQHGLQPRHPPRRIQWLLHRFCDRWGMLDPLSLRGRLFHLVLQPALYPTFPFRI